MPMEGRSRSFSQLGREAGKAAHRFTSSRSSCGKSARRAAAAPQRNIASRRSRAALNVLMVTSGSTAQSRNSSPPDANASISPGSFVLAPCARIASPTRRLMPTTMSARTESADAGLGLLSSDAPDRRDEPPNDHENFGDAGAGDWRVECCRTESGTSARSIGATRRWGSDCRERPLRARRTT
jgi:hypothetical protein